MEACCQSVMPRHMVGQAAVLRHPTCMPTATDDMLQPAGEEQTVGLNNVAQRKEQMYSSKGAFPCAPESSQATNDPALDYEFGGDKNLCLNA